MNSEQIQQIHPILKAKGVHVYWKGNVGKINTKGDVQPRYLVITSIGIFLMVKRTFPSGFKLSRTIPMVMLKTITLTTDYLALDSDTTSMVIQHEKINEITALLVTIQTEINGPAVFKASTQLKMVVSDRIFEIPKKRFVIDRFESECLACNIPIQVDQVNSICKTLDADRETISFTASIAASSYLPAIINTLKGESTYKTLILKDLSFMSFYPNLIKILTTSSSIETIIFYKVTFLEKSFNIPQDAFSKTISPITTFKLYKCDFTNPKTKDLIYILSQLNAHITSLSVDNCKFIPATLEAMFYSIFDSQCFKSLTKAVFNNINLPENFQVFAMQLVNCDWVLKNKALKHLRLENMPLQLDVLLKTILIFETGLEEVSLSGCSFTKPLESGVIQNFQMITHLDLSGLTTTSEALLSFITYLDTVPSNLISLDLTHFKMGHQDLIDFYSKLGTLKLGHLQSLVWDKNIVPNDKVDNFIQFLLAQTELIDLSISNCFVGLPAIAEKLIQLTSLNFQRFVMVGSGKCIFGHDLNKVLEKLITKGTLTILDVTGHTIGDDGLKLITQFVESGAKGIAFGKTNATSVDTMLECLEAIINADIEFAQWPANDVKRVITKVPLGQRDKIIKQYSIVKKKFHEKFKIEPDQDDQLDDEQAESPIRMKRLSSMPLLIRSPSDANLVSRVEPIDYDSTTFREDQVKELLAECIGQGSIQPINDPLIIYYNKFIIENSIDRFALQ